MEYGLLNKKDHSQVALKAVDICADMVGEALLVRSTQQYLNDSGKNAEFIYTFPLPEQAAVCDFTARIGKKLIRGEIGEKEKAFKDYDAALQRGDTAILMEQVRANVFQVSLGQINANESAEISISYFQEIKSNDNQLRIAIPTLLAPRYIPGKPVGQKNGPGEVLPTDQVVDADFISPPIGVTGYQATIGLRLKTLIPISSIISPSHEIKIDQPDPYTASLTLAEGSSKLDRDFVVNVSLQGENLPRLLYGKNQNDEFFALASYTPELPAVEKKQAKDYIFLIDISGSMEGKKLSSAANALQICLRNLGAEDTFNMIAFESDLHTFSSRSLAYNQKNLDRATAWVKRLKSMGGTEIMPAVQLALEDNSSTEKIVFLFTDGQVGNEQEVINLVKKHNANLRLYSLGIDTAVNSNFINQIAAAGNGEAEFVYPGEDLEDKVLRHFSRIDASYMENIKFQFNNASARDLAGEIPARLYDLENYTHLFRLAECPTGKLVIRGKSAVQDIMIEIKDIQEIENGEVLEKLWAKRKIDALEGYLQWGNHRRTKTIQEEIIALSQQYRVLSSLTSFLAVYEREEKLSGMPETLVIPVDIPYGWDMFKDMDVDMAVSSYSVITNDIISTLTEKIEIKEDKMISMPSRSRVTAGPNLKRGQVVKTPLLTDKLKKLAVEQNSDGSFGAIDAAKATLIAATAAAIIDFCQNATHIGIFRQQLLKAIDYLRSMEQEIMMDDALLKKVSEALKLARTRKVLRQDNQLQNEFADRIMNTV
ncbi:MAG TPA: VIT and VWA domain-containing protein [Desulfitobacteriaceae bacterium]|nr:VIT and VWA domain-containing protein [Desulfitobacteriaceae bacterium]